MENTETLSSHYKISIPSMYELRPMIRVSSISLIKGDTAELKANVILNAR